MAVFSGTLHGVFRRTVVGAGQGSAPAIDLLHRKKIIIRKLILLMQLGSGSLSRSKELQSPYSDPRNYKARIHIQGITKPSPDPKNTKAGYGSKNPSSLCDHIESTESTTILFRSRAPL